LRSHVIPDAEVIEDIPQRERISLIPILRKSFEGKYLWHSTKTLKEVDLVRAALVGKTPVGVSMVRMLNERAGYIYYVAVLPKYRNKGIGGRLLDDGLRLVAQKGARDALAVIPEGNISSERLFLSRGFTKKIFADLSAAFGRKNAIMMYRTMFVSWGEAVYMKELDSYAKS